LIARISGTCIAIIAVLWSALALSIDTAFSGTYIVVIASKDVLAFSTYAFISGTSVVVVTVDWSAHTSLSRNTRISGAWIFVIAKTSIWSAYATNARIASISSTWDSVVTVLWSVDDSPL
jgi:hypothetical protein